MASQVPLRPFASLVNVSSSSSLHTLSRNAYRTARTRYFSSSSPHHVNLTRPTTTTRTATTAAATKPASAAPKAPVTPSKPAIPVSSAPQAQPPAQNAPRSLTQGLDDLNPMPDATPVAGDGSPVDWSRSFHGLSSTPFSEKAADALMAPISPEDVEIKPDGILYLPEIKYRRILNRAFGPGGWGLAPRGETIVTGKNVTREYGLVVHGRLVSIARGEQQYFDPEGIPTATEGCKSNALMRCCKDLGIASELWDPVFIRKFKAEHSKQVWVEHVTTKRKKQIHMRKDVNIAPGGFKLS